METIQRQDVEDQHSDGDGPADFRSMSAARVRPMRFWDATNVGAGVWEDLSGIYPRIRLDSWRSPAALHTATAGPPRSAPPTWLEQVYKRRHG
jgi:hypothetical protein